MSMGEAERAEDTPVDEAAMREHASKGKRDRAKPVSAKYGQGRIQHRRVLQELQDQMCAFGAPGGEPRSPGCCGSLRSGRRSTCCIGEALFPRAHDEPGERADGEGFGQHDADSNGKLIGLDAPDEHQRGERVDADERSAHHHGGERD